MPFDLRILRICEIEGLRGPAPRAIRAIDSVRSKYVRTRALKSGGLHYDAPEHAAIDIRGVTNRPRNALCERLFVADKT